MYPTYARSERIADGAMHAIGVLGAITGAVILIIWASGHASGGHIAAISIYGATLIATFTASAMYHMTPWESIRPALHKLDHTAIYLKIAGTYTPLVTMIGSSFAYIILCVVWALALIGMAMRLILWRTSGRFGLVLYLVMGWLGVGLIWSLWSIIPGIAMGLIVVGGILYTAGVPFCKAESLKYSMAIWHAFVVTASTCFFIAIAVGVRAVS